MKWTNGVSQEFVIGTAWAICGMPTSTDTHCLYSRPANENLRKLEITFTPSAFFFIFYFWTLLFSLFHTSSIFSLSFFSSFSHRNICPVAQSTFQFTTKGVRLRSGLNTWVFPLQRWLNKFKNILALDIFLHHITNNYHIIENIRMIAIIIHSFLLTRVNVRLVYVNFLSSRLCTHIRKPWPR